MLERYPKEAQKECLITDYLAYSRKCISAVGFRIFRKPLLVNPSAAEDFTIAYVYLHNFLRRKSAVKQLYSPPETLDFENADEVTVIEGERRKEIQNDNGMIKLAKPPRNHGNDAKKVRNTFLDYCSLCRMKDECRGKINICSKSYITQS
jgi:hypothetical protein